MTSRKTQRSKKPPKSIRFCPNCNKDTIWEYNRNIGHSECVECGCRNYKV